MENLRNWQVKKKDKLYYRAKLIFKTADSKQTENIPMDAFLLSCPEKH